ncbi:hypothetical protein [Actinomadura sp. NEAU-AAG7]|uniref:hypothetical protein n=1 Tax=Actinomadura sp. NEAU-AAG7 TaxID=2839640 RepID=UPI001BE433A0|nr:hypothetical protein [Actinomadura sp. NEAU-AAG7]MBT2207525.1 hypothetical protein [Actinomadura sp. NEAU-AAG7]
MTAQLTDIENRPPTNETEQESAQLEGELRAISTGQVVASDGVAKALHQTGELVRAVIRAHPVDKAELYAKLGLKMTYYPQKQLMEAGAITTICTWRPPSRSATSSASRWGTSRSYRTRRDSPGPHAKQPASGPEVIEDRRAWMRTDCNTTSQVSPCAGTDRRMPRHAGCPRFRT